MLASQNLFYPLVLNCLYAECLVLGGGVPKDTRGISKEAISNKLRAALLLSASDTHDNKPTRTQADKNRVSRAVSGLLKAGLAEHDLTTTYRITPGGLKVIDSLASLSGIARLCTEALRTGKSARLTRKALERIDCHNMPDANEDISLYNEANTLLFLLCDQSSVGNRKFEAAACEAVEELTGLTCKLTPYVADEGIDGECYDEAGNLVALIQAKRYTGIKKVNNAPVSQLMGDCLRRHVDTGYFVTTSTFAPSAVRVVEADCAVKIVPIDGHQVAQLLEGSHTLVLPNPEDPASRSREGKPATRAADAAERKAGSTDFKCRDFAEYLERVGADAYQVSDAYFKKMFGAKPYATCTLKDQVVGWFWDNDSRGYGEFARKVPNSSARTCYQRLGNPAMLLWVAEAVGIEKGTTRAAAKAARAKTHSSSACAAVRHAIPWEDIAAHVDPCALGTG